MGHNESEHVVDSVNRVLDFVLKSMRASPTARVNLAYFTKLAIKLSNKLFWTSPISFNLCAKCCSSTDQREIFKKKKIITGIFKLLLVSLFYKGICSVDSKSKLRIYKI